MVFSRLRDPGAEGSAGAMLGAGKPFSPARPPSLKRISKRSMETTAKLIPGGGFMACGGDEDPQEVAVMGKENRAE